jgi:hypothetical protein
MFYHCQSKQIHIKTNHLLLVTSDGELIFRLTKVDIVCTSVDSINLMIDGQVKSKNKGCYKVMAILHDIRPRIQFDRSLQLSTASIIPCSQSWTRATSPEALIPLFTVQNDRNISHWYFGKYTQPVDLYNSTGSPYEPLIPQTNSQTAHTWSVYNNNNNNFLTLSLSLLWSCRKWNDWLVLNLRWIILIKRTEW